MSYHTNLLLRLQEVERALVGAGEQAEAAFEYATDDRHAPALVADCRSLLLRLDEAQYNVTTALRHLEEEDHA